MQVCALGHTRPHMPSAHARLACWLRLLIVLRLAPFPTCVRGDLYVECIAPCRQGAVARNPHYFVWRVPDADLVVIPRHVPHRIPDQLDPAICRCGGFDLPAMDGPSLV